MSLIRKRKAIREILGKKKFITYMKLAVSNVPDSDSNNIRI